MKNKKSFLGLFFFLAVFCLILTACPDALIPGFEDDLPVLTGDIGISSSLSSPYKVGTVLTADTTKLEGSGTIGYVWLRGDTSAGDFFHITGATSSTYQLTDEDNEKFIKLMAVRTGYIGTVSTVDPWSVGVLLPADAPELGGSLSVIGEYIVGETLTADTSDLIGEGETIYFQWIRETAPDSNTYNAITGETADTYTLTEDDLGLRISVSVTMEGYAGARQAVPVVVTAAQGSLPELTGSVGLSGSSPFRIGSTLGAMPNNLSGTGTISYIWLRGETSDGDFLPIEGAVSSIYTITQADENKLIRASVSRAGSSGTLTSGWWGIGPLLPESAPDLTGNFTVDGDYIVGNTLTANVTQLSGTEPYTYQWYREINNNWSPIPGAINKTYTLVEEDVGLRVYVRVTKDGYAGSRSSNPVTVVPVGTAPPLTGNIGWTSNNPIPSKVGDVLTGTINNLGGSGNISYQWQRGASFNGSFVVIPGATSITYALVDADANMFVRFVVSREGNTGTVSTTYPTAILPANAPELTGNLTVDGDYVVGNTLTANVTQLSGTEPYMYQWFRGINNSWSPIPNAVNKSYTLAEDDEGLSIYVRVTREGFARSRSSNTVTVAPKGTLPPLTGWIGWSSNQPTPIKVGAVLTATTNNLGGIGNISYQWQRGASLDGSFTNIEGATNISYTLVDADANMFIRLSVGREGYTGTVSTTYSTAILPADTPELTGNFTVDGNYIVGETLTANISQLSGTEPYTYQWYREINNNWNPIPGAVNKTYTLVEEDVGLRVYVRVTREGYAGSRSSNPVIVAPKGSAPPITGWTGWSMSHSKPNKVGHTLFAMTDNVGGSGEIFYQWQRGDSYNGPFTNIEGATNSAYTLVDADANKFIRLVVSREGYSGSLTTTDPSAMLPASAPELGGSVSLTGDFIVGETVTVNLSGLTGEAGETYYEWYWETAPNNWNPIPGVTGNSYTLTQDDLGRRFFVVVNREGHAGSRQTNSSPPVAPIGSDPPLAGYIGFNTRQNAKVGDVMISWTDGLGGTGAISYVWQRGTSSNGSFVAIPGATGENYTLVNDDAGMFIRLEVNRTGHYGNVSATYSTAILPASAPVLGGSISFTGDFIVGQTVSINISNMTGEAGTTHYQWSRETAPNSNNWNFIPGVTGNSYTLTQDDLGRRFYVTVTREGHADARFTSDSPPVAPIGSDPPLAGYIGFNTRQNAKVGDVMIAWTDGLDGTGDFSYVWQRGDSQSGAFTNIAGAIGVNYTLVDDDANMFIRLVVSRSGNSGTVSSTYSTAILPASAPEMGGTVTITGTLVVGQEITADISEVTGGTGNTQYRWFSRPELNTGGTFINGATGSTYTLTSNDLGLYIGVQVSRTGDAGVVSSSIVGPITAE